MALALDDARLADATLTPLLEVSRLLHTLPYDMSEEVLARHPRALEWASRQALDASPYPDMDAWTMARWTLVYDLLEDLHETLDATLT